MLPFIVGSVDNLSIFGFIEHFLNGADSIPGLFLSGFADSNLRQRLFLSEIMVVILEFGKFEFFVFFLQLDYNLLWMQ